MTIEAKVILDSLAPNGARLTTFELTYPRFIHAELMTHRVFSRNAASSRAIPTHKKIARIREDCAKPSEWGRNQKGMQAGGPLDAESAKWAELIWGEASEEALRYAEVLCGIRCARCKLQNDWEGNGCSCDLADAVRLDLHKQVANRILEPFDHITVVLSTTKLRNHFKLRTEIDEITKIPKADPTYFELATKWKAAFDDSTPYKCQADEWHLPYVQAYDASGMTRMIPGHDVTAIWAHIEEAAIQNEAMKQLSFIRIAKQISTGRCARVSYMRQGQGDVADNIKLHDGLAAGGHWSPFEHVAAPMDSWSPLPDETNEKTHHYRCAWCHAWVGRAIMFKPQRVAICLTCAHGHIHSGNFHGWHQYRKEFAQEAGGD